MSHSIDALAEALKSARLSEGISQQALARRVGLPQSHVSRIERGAVDLRLSSLVELARALGLEVMLVPRKKVSAVRSLARDTRSGGPEGRREPEPVKPAYSLEDDDHG